MAKQKSGTKTLEQREADYKRKLAEITTRKQIRDLRNSLKKK